MAQSLWGLALTGAIQEPPRIASLNKRPFYHPGNDKGLRSSVSGAGVGDQIPEQRMYQVVSSLENHHGLRSPVLGTGVRDQHLSIYSHSVCVYVLVSVSMRLCVSVLRESVSEVVGEIFHCIPLATS